MSLKRLILMHKLNLSLAILPPFMEVLPPSSLLPDCSRLTPPTVCRWSAPWRLPQRLALEITPDRDAPIKELAIGSGRAHPEIIEALNSGVDPASAWTANPLQRQADRKGQAHRKPRPSPGL